MAKVMKLAAAVWLSLLLLPVGGRTEVDARQYQKITQSELVADREGFQDKKVHVVGTFLFTGSDFCYQIRKTKINTRDYFCFALGAPSLVRMYLRKDHPQADTLLGLRKGAEVEAFGTFDFVGSNYNFMVVDEILVGPSG